MNVNYLNAIGNHGASLITHIALVDAADNEVGDGRREVSWTNAEDGLVRPTEDLVFIMSANEDVAGWRGFNAATDGINYGGADLGSVTFNNDGEYTLVAAQTGIDHNAVS